MILMVRLSEAQVEKISAYMLDVSKLLVGATVVPLFIPGSIFNAWLFLGGASISLLLFGFGLSIIKQRL